MRLLLIEDDFLLVQQLRSELERAGFAVDSAGSVREGAILGNQEDYRAAVLDLGLPDGNGLALLQDWRDRDRNFPVLILTARGEWQDKVNGLKAGADDYLAKPFHSQELIARLHALIRRSEGHIQPLIRAGDYCLDTDRQQVQMPDGEWHPLTGMEFRLLRLLMSRPGRVYSKSELMEQLYSLDESPSANLIEAYVRRLRLMLGPQSIETRRGQGYVFPQ